MLLPDFLINFREFDVNVLIIFLKIEVIIILTTLKINSITVCQQQTAKLTPSITRNT